MEKLVVESMNINIELNGLITSVIGPTESGKTYLFKKLINIIPNKDVYIDNKGMNEYELSYLKQNIVMVLNDDMYYTSFVVDELSYHLKELGLSLDKILTIVYKFIEEFNLSKYKHERLNKIPLNKRIYIKILSYLIIHPSLIGIDNLLSYLEKEDKEHIIKYIKKNNITLLNVISELDDVIYGDRVLIMNHFKQILYGDNKIILENNSILPYMGIRLPFVVDLSQNLMLYKLVNKVYLDKDKLVSKLWK